MNRHIQNGLPKGITFRKHGKNPNSFVFRVTNGKQQTDIGANADTFSDCYLKAIEKRLELVGEESNDNLKWELVGTFDAFLRHYGIVLMPTIKHEIQITKG
jgi:hypothetical protein